MNKLDSFYNKIILGNIDKVALGVMIILLIGFSYSIYFLFNRPIDPKVETKIKQESQSTEIKFDEETIEKITESKNYGSNLNPSTEGKNPFITY